MLKPSCAALSGGGLGVEPVRVKRPVTPAMRSKLGEWKSRLESNMAALPWPVIAKMTGLAIAMAAGIALCVLFGDEPGPVPAQLDAGILLRLLP